MYGGDLKELKLNFSREATVGCDATTGAGANSDGANSGTDETDAVSREKSAAGIVFALTSTP